MKTLLNILLGIAVSILTVLLVACKMPLDFDLDMSGYEIFPSGNPQWTGDGSSGWGYNPYVLSHAASIGKVTVACGIAASAYTDNDSSWVVYKRQPYGWSDPAIASVDSLFYMTSWTGHILKSKNGISWEVAGYDISKPVGMAYSGHEIVVAAIPPELYRARFLVSSDGSSWTRVEIDSILLNSFIWADSQFVACGSRLDTTVVMLFSKDGQAWESRTVSPSGLSLRGLIWCGDRFLAYADSMGIYSSFDGVNWNLLEGLYPISSLYWNDGRYFAVSASNIYYSDNGTDWEKSILPDKSSPRAVSWSGTKYFGFGWETIIESSDGAVWKACPVSIIQ